MQKHAHDVKILHGPEALFGSKFDKVWNTSISEILIVIREFEITESSSTLIEADERLKTE